MVAPPGVYEIEPNTNGEGMIIGIAMSRFNGAISKGLLGACTAELERLGVRREDTLVVTVPGALEIPIALKRLADAGQFDALIAVGAVIRGETYHFEIVSNESASGIMRVQLDTGLPIANAVLTTEDEAQAIERAATKGAEAARAAIEMANLLQAIEDERD